MKHVWWWYLLPWVGLARMTEAYEDALVIVREQSMELHKLRLETAGLWRIEVLEESLREQAAEIAALREAVLEARVALAEIRTLLHCQGRRPEECYAMSVADDAIGAIRRALEEKR